MLEWRKNKKMLTTQENIDEFLKNTDQYVDAKKKLEADHWDIVDHLQSKYKDICNVNPMALEFLAQHDFKDVPPEKVETIKKFIVELDEIKKKKEEQYSKVKSEFKDMILKKMKYDDEKKMREMLDVMISRFDNYPEDDGTEYLIHRIGEVISAEIIDSIKDDKERERVLQISHDEFKKYVRENMKNDKLDRLCQYEKKHDEITQESIRRMFSKDEIKIPTNKEIDNSLVEHFKSLGLTFQ